MTTTDTSTKFDTLLEEVAKKHDVEANLLRKLIDFERTKVHLEKRRGVKEQIRKIIEEEGGN